MQNAQPEAPVGGVATGPVKSFRLISASRASVASGLSLLSQATRSNGNLFHWSTLWEDRPMFFLKCYFSLVS